MNISAYSRRCATFAFLFALSGVVQAGIVSIDFTDGAGDNAASFQKTAGTATATFSNPVGDPFNNSTLGLGLGSGSFPAAFDVSFDQDVQLLSYGVGFAPGSITFDIIGPGVSSLANGQTAGDFNSQPLALQANQAYTVSGNFAGFGNAVVFSNWTLDDGASSANVPAPGALLLLLGGLGASIRLRHHKRG